ncbi:signal recognition particle protein [Acidimicrobium ferrooxidans DSM 10331]|uniref:Signal recognition particle protein n=1 Tax=Acidimicrobium ferrooxidans (strain DSM 10331 / JCM 15462 / NBRC 103882 / ICP) TaxID=525909 RepID=C7M0B7_ACIFD|nr:signal recognition particle protein [Acidimicrobium ferrooxidans]ACU54425.1 signal recognition particle protein [Acidimicrobium ferrooxidans DSM 10331]
MFETLSGRLDGALGRLRRKSRLTQRDVDEALAEIRVALLEADVAVRVVDTILARVEEAAVGAMASASLTPGQQVVKAVHDELLRVLGGEPFRLRYASTPPTVILLAGLQGVGKTTAAAKLALAQLREGRSPLLVAADLQRPGAIEQLRILGERAGVAVVSDGDDPVTVARHGVAEARRLGRDVVIVDTAGRLAIDEALMREVQMVSEAIDPHYRFLVVDAMVGQESVRVAQAFDERLSISAVILTKLDGDARGGAALSVREVVGKPIAFASVGEKLEDFEPFYPDRMASRILGMGDVLSLIERAESTMDHEVAQRGVDRLRQGRFDLNDLLEQMRQVRRLGPLKGVLAMLPGVPKELRNQDIDDAELTRIEAMISSMTREERSNPTMIDASRRARIARGSGTQPAQVAALLKQFRDVHKVLRQAGVGAPSATKRRKPPRRKRK